jgi:N-acetylglucosaminyldiphosphoundecaprenol N-acetyl-beta-D-mannosaminyltransferase
MVDYGKKNIIGVLVDAVDYEAAVSRIIAAARARQPLSVSALAVHGVMTGYLDEEHRYRLNHFDLLVPDGQPVRWAMRLLYATRLPDRVYGPTLTLKVCEQAAQEGLPIYLYGSREVVLENLVRNLQRSFPGLIVAGAEPSRFRQTTPSEKQEIVARIKASGAAIVLVGLGCPRQEVWAYEYRDDLSLPILAVGAAFDFHAGTLSQAPLPLQRWGMEWFYRLIQEPRRLWRRYLLLSPKYLAMLSLQALHLRDFDPDTAVAPCQPIYYG